MFDFLDGLFDDHHAGDLFGDDLHTSDQHHDGPDLSGAPGHGDDVRFASSGHNDPAFHHHDPNASTLAGRGHSAGPAAQPEHRGRIRFGEWVRWPGGNYERDPDGHYTGRSSK